jgi:hypothetical protein
MVVTHAAADEAKVSSLIFSFLYTAEIVRFDSHPILGVKSFNGLGIATCGRSGVSAWPVSMLVLCGIGGTLS